MGLLDVLNGMQNGPHGPSHPSTQSNGGMSPMTMAILALLAWKAVKHFSQPGTAPAPTQVPPPAPANTGGGLGGGDDQERQAGQVEVLRRGGELVEAGLQVRAELEPEQDVHDQDEGSALVERDVDLLGDLPLRGHRPDVPHRACPDVRSLV